MALTPRHALCIHIIPNAPTPIRLKKYIYKKEVTQNCSGHEISPGTAPVSALTGLVGCRKFSYQHAGNVVNRMLENQSTDFCLFAVCFPLSILQHIGHTKSISCQQLQLVPLLCFKTEDGQSFPLSAQELCESRGCPGFPVLKVKVQGF